MQDSCTVGMVIECFQDHYAFEKIGNINTLSHDLMFDEMFLYDNEQTAGNFGSDQDN